MAAAFVQATTGEDDHAFPGQASLALTAFGSSTGSGNHIIVAIFYDDGGSTITSSVTDTFLNSYSPVAAAFEDANSQTMRFFYAENITGGASHVVTCNFAGVGGAAFINAIAHEVAGLATTSSLDQHSESQDTSAAPSIAVTTTTNGQYIFAAVMNDGGTASDTYSQGTGETERATASAGSNESMSEDAIQVSAGSYTADWVRSGSGHNLYGIATFKAGAPTATLMGAMVM